MPPLTQSDTPAALRPNVTEADAVRAFSAITPSNVYWQKVRGPLQRLAAAYVPFRLFHVEYELGAARNARWFAVDRVQGALDLFEFAAEPEPRRLTELPARNYVASQLSDEQTESTLSDKVLRVIFQQGFFRVRETRLKLEASPLDLYMPYWLAFYGSELSLRCRVLDATRRRIEGPKASQLFETWLREPQLTAEGSIQHAASL
jgi:hypothetical protein